MNLVLENIRTRRSVRKFKPCQVEQDKLDLILEAGTWAPTAMGKQSPKIIAVQKPEEVAKVVELNAKFLGTQNNPYYGAPTILLVLTAPCGTSEEDGSCVLQNMMLAAHSQGLATCWIHREKQMFDCDEVKALLKAWGIEEELVGVGSLALGYADCDLPDPKPRKEDYIVKVL